MRIMAYTVKKLAQLAGVSVRTLHYYDRIGLLKPAFLTAGGYRQYREAEVLKLQQILFFKELGFELAEIKSIIASPNFDLFRSLQDHRRLLAGKLKRTRQLMTTIDRTIQKLEGEREMEIREYYEGFSEEKIERYRNEVKEHWGAKTLEESEARVLEMGKETFSELQEEGSAIFQEIARDMDKGPGSPEIQALIYRWRQWLEHFHHYSDEAVMGLGQMYSNHPEFMAFFEKIRPGLASFLARAVEYRYRGVKGGN
jgi:DNA-binding transcriptional MerR regulator